MAFCTTTDVYLEAGTTTGTATITDIDNMITRSDEEIAEYLTINNVAVPSSSSSLKTASIALTIAKLKRRQSHELSRPNSLNLGGDISFSVAVDAEIKALKEAAKEAMNQYIASVNSGLRASRVRTRSR